MLVKSLQEDDHLSDLQETFNTLLAYNMKLNLNKCVFGVTAGKFLGFMVSQKGIEVNSEKIRAIVELAPPKTAKEVQTGSSQGLPFFCTLKKSFEWTDEC